ncbi:Hypothetical predicted protein [Octopus vulgaris]|uniref:Uncharacterized protein n=1 Tax=Octopus vulgaris TaxID=6645 RepID=A0AA36BQX4_OCTVU|nr:Hypothetical predicted protein [Octopus vulgaris]
MCAYHQMYKSTPTADMLKPEKNIRLAADNGQEIKCLGPIHFQLCSNGSKFHDAKFYVVDVDGPPIIGLPTGEAIKLDSALDITTIKGLKETYPNLFDSLGNFKGPTQLYIKARSEPFIDPPWKCSVHLEKKLNIELWKMEEMGGHQASGVQAWNIL